MRYVVDANVLLKGFLPEVGSDQARGLLQRITAGEIAACAPQILVAEIGHTLRREILRKRLQRDETGQIWRDLNALPIALFSLRDLADSAWELALENTARFCDALYIALAVREDLKVLTADERGRRPARLNRTIPLAGFRLS